MDLQCLLFRLYWLGNMKDYKRGLVSGVFDFYHTGHQLFMKQCRDLCEELHVAVSIDPSKEKSWKSSPIMSLAERFWALSRDQNIDFIFPFDKEEELDRFLYSGLYDVHFLGDDHINSKDPKMDEKRNKCYANNISLIFVPGRNYRWTSTAIRNRVAEASK